MHEFRRFITICEMLSEIDRESVPIPANDNEIPLIEKRAKARIDSLWAMAQTNTAQVLREARQYATMVEQWPEDAPAQRRLKADIMERIRGLIQFLEAP